jgi:ABC-2 type transport system permease protein
MGGVIANSAVIAVIQAVLTIGIGAAAYDLSAPRHWGPFILALAVGIFTFSAIGIAATVWVPNADAAGAVITFPYLVIAFISGTFFPLSSSSFLTDIGRVFPVYHFIQALFAPFDPRRGGSGIAGSDLAIMAIWGAAAVVFALRRFRWEPQHR